MLIENNNLTAFVKSLTMRKYDYYVTPNTLIADRRTTENIFSLNNIVIDIDAHDKNLTQQERDEMIEEFLWRAKRDLLDTKTLPRWNVTHITGRGVHLWWSIEETSSQLSWLYLIAVNRFIKAFQWLLEQYPDIKLTVDTGASHRLTGYFRLFGTYNIATGSKTTYTIETTERYNLNDMLEKYTLEQIAEDEEEEESQDQDNSNKAMKDKTYKALQHKRIRFIEKKVERMNKECVGIRDIMTFL